MPIESITAEKSFSVLIRLKIYVRSTIKNDRLSSLGLMHIHRDFEGGGGVRGRPRPTPFKKLWRAHY
jgi:hypothetical protein